MESPLTTERAGGCELRDTGGPEPQREGRSARLGGLSGLPAAARGAIGLGIILTYGRADGPLLCALLPPCPWGGLGLPTVLPWPEAATGLMAGAGTTLGGKYFRKPARPTAPPLAKEGLLTCGQLSCICLVTVPPHGLLGHHVIQVSYLRQPPSGLQTG